MASSLCLITKESSFLKAAYQGGIIFVLITKKIIEADLKNIISYINYTYIIEMKEIYTTVFTYIEIIVEGIIVCF